MKCARRDRNTQCLWVRLDEGMVIYSLESDSEDLIPLRSSDSVARAWRVILVRKKATQAEPTTQRVQSVHGQKLDWRVGSAASAPEART